MSQARIDNSDALGTLQALGPAAREAAREAVNTVAKNLAAGARDRTTAVYNIAAGDLAQFIGIKPAPQGSRRASVTLKVRAIPHEKFSPTVSMVPTPVRIFGRKTPATIPLAQVSLKIYRNGAPRVLRGYFPLRQRTSGALRKGEALRRRVGKSLKRRDGTEGAKLTGLRYVTFPRRFLDRLLPELQKAAGDDVLVQFNAAWRKRTSRGQRELRGPR